MPKVMWKYEVNKRYDRALIWLSYHTPKRFVMWCAIRVINNACTGEYRNQEVPALLAMDALKRWDTQ